MRTFFKYLLRTLALPFVFGISTIAAIRNLLFTMWQWWRYGGEMVFNDEVFNPKTIQQMFNEVNLNSKSQIEIRELYNKALEGQQGNIKKLGEILETMAEIITKQNGNENTYKGQNKAL